MRKEIIVVLLSLFSMILSAQKNSLEELMNGIEVLEKYKKEIVWTTLVYETFTENNLKLDFDLKNRRELNVKLMSLYDSIIQNYTSSEIYPNALFYNAKLKQEFGLDEEAFQLFHKYIEGDWIDIEKDRYAHNRVGEYFFSKGEYEKAIKYLILENLKGIRFRTYYYCLGTNNLETVELLTKSYFALNENQMALSTMLEPILHDKCAGFRRYILFVKDELTKRFSAKLLKDEWIKAIDNIKYREVENGYEGQKEPYIVFLGAEIINYGLSDRITEEHSLTPKERILKSTFHQWIESL